MKNLALLLALALPCAAAWGNGYTYRRALTIDHTKIPDTDQLNFPVLASGTYSYLATVANGGHVQNASGYDVIFTSDAAGATKLSWEVEQYTAASGKVAYWVKVPTVSHTADTVIYLFYGNAGISSFQGGSAAAVWDANYVGVWHLSDVPAFANDSTSNANNATTIGGTATAGEIAGAANFTPTQNVLVPDSTSLQSTVTLTVETWFYLASLPSTYVELVRKGTPWYLFINPSNKLGLAIDDDYGDSPLYSVTAGWTHVVATYDGSQVTLYVNGAAAGSYAHSAIALDTTQLWFASTETGGGGQYFTGRLDEVRVSKTVRSGDWIASEYANENSPSTFVALGEEQQSTAQAIGIVLNNPVRM